MLQKFKCMMVVICAVFYTNVAWAGEEWKPQYTSLLADSVPHDVVYGDGSAPLRVVEYASLSCGHCKSFYDDVFPEIKKEYIDTGKVQLIYRHFPLNLSALRASQLVSCVEGAEKQHRFIAALFAGQEEWAYQRNEPDVIDKLKMVARVGGVSEDDFQACLDNKVIENEILEQQLKASKELNVNSTPALFVGDEPFLSRKTIKTLKDAIDEALEKIKSE